MTSPEQADAIEAMKAEVKRLAEQFANQKIASGTMGARDARFALFDSIDRLAAVALHPAPSEPPEGFVLVPREPTQEMLDKGDHSDNMNYNHTSSQVRIRHVYRAMLAATPQVHPEESDEDFAARIEASNADWKPAQVHPAQTAPALLGGGHGDAEAPVWTMRLPVDEPVDVMLNGLTEAETAATASVAGLTQTAPADALGALTKERLTQLLILTQFVPADAVDSAEDYDAGVTVMRIEWLHQKLAAEAANADQGRSGSLPSGGPAAARTAALRSVPALPKPYRHEETSGGGQITLYTRDQLVAYAESLAKEQKP
jgi:hypothetical protein